MSNPRKASAHLHTGNTDALRPTKISKELTNILQEELQFVAGEQLATLASQQELQTRVRDVVTQLKAVITIASQGRP